MSATIKPRPLQVRVALSVELGRGDEERDQTSTMDVLIQARLLSEVTL